MDSATLFLKSLFPSTCFRKRKSKSQQSPITPSTTIILSHGAFNTTWHYNLYTTALQKDDFRAICPQQSSSGPSPPPNSFDADIEMLHETVMTELLAGRDVLLVCHSYGGIPGCEALADLPIKPMEGRRLGRVLGIVFVSAFVAEEGMSLVTSKMAGRASWVRVEGDLCYVNDPAPTLFNTIQSESLRQQCIDRLVPQASSSFMAVTKHETWKDFPCYYVRCLHDQAMVPEEQDFFTARLREHNSEARVKELPSDHAPFASMPERMAELTGKIVAELRGGRVERLK